ncbi:MAG: hypothetical protein UU05_C0028G0004 [Candidatus Curtissbacteria bacterium GW2011_GWA1_40_47]|uniref:DUF4446 domain-containing protein n=1 Tax=Candidatus Curtissbacteria bacterium RIFOXYA1_FULL_41_14 TaxID=1797737 RepID=A0A1F5HBV8_9BACT|nr:MAG: hypothetical protein UT95_C0032G0005 [Candidatus Curtissbacteria bacterium GW2011_GWB1_40_28]KKR60653.1 MAG: hypothetical protein UT99_C0010G0018 [Candidatus Curtissbacteria bacterium GW2011_GWA2_40_31]KKR61686.1 MAG: hypothetical protein UU00_C0009G0008 [Microgenomates group bacterium GW2011_GWC1_40_35]KKR65108.1 MAG: hypothetical protein UU05_C0028G0004 [Candidatus Curtissbacteria bacterium GW2011_GWA1_40_47]KKS01047.1 MAG: hypothetical protein UU53_C0020G0008 [Candidatus Curtissbacte
MWQQVRATDYLLIVLGIWLAILSVYLIKTIGHYRRLTKGAKGQTLDRILEEVIEKVNLQNENRQQLTKQIQKLDQAQKGSFTKHALIRFNPFEDTGGDQSFVLALLDGANNGVVISSLHSRGGTRVYAKGVSGAKPTTHPFSKEEKEVVEKAARQAV